MIMSRVIDKLVEYKKWSSDQSSKSQNYEDGDPASMNDL